MHPSSHMTAITPNTSYIACVQCIEPYVCVSTSTHTYTCTPTHSHTCTHTHTPSILLDKDHRYCPGLHWDQRTHNTSLTLGPEDTQHIHHTGTRGNTTHPSHWDQRTHNTSITLGPEDTQHIPHTGTRGHTTHTSHRDQRTHNTSLTLGPEDTQHIPHTGTRGHTTHPSHCHFVDTKRTVSFLATEKV